MDRRQAPFPPHRLPRCPWRGMDDLYVAYHDREWGVPVHDRRAFAGFDPEQVARFDQARIKALLADPGIIRNRAKIEAAVTNVRAFLRLAEAFGSFDAYIWRFVDGRPRIDAWRRLEDVPASTPESEAMSRDLRRRGFRFVGPTMCYTFMQAVGMVNDHLISCFRYRELGGAAAAPVAAGGADGAADSPAHGGA